MCLDYNNSRMDICRSIQENPIYKVKLWTSQNDAKIFVFVGKNPRYKDLINKISDKTPLTTKEKELLNGDYGASYVSSWGSNTNFVFESIYYDDSINIIKRKLCMHIIDMKDNIDNDIYMWVDRELKNTTSLQLGMTKHILQGKRSIKLSKFIELWQYYISNPFPENLKNMEKVYKEDIVEAIKNSKITYVKSPLGLRYIKKKYLQFVPVNPFIISEQTSINLKDDTFNIDQDGTTTIETFKIKSNVINVTTTKYFTDQDLRHIYFPNAKFTRKTPDPSKTSNEVEFLNRYDEILNEVSNFNRSENEHKNNIKVEAHLNYLHLRLNETSTNELINVLQIFNAMSTTSNVPFIKYNSSTNKIYKVDKKALSITGEYRINPSDLDIWIESNPNDLKGRSTQEFVMFKIFIKNVSTHNKFASVIIYPDTHIDIKFNIRANDDTSCESVAHGFKPINDLLERISAILPDTFIPRIDKEFWKKHESFTDVKLLNMAATISIIKPKTKIADLKILVKRLFPFFNILEYANEKLNGLSLLYKRVNKFVKLDNIAIFLNQKQSLDHQTLIQELIKAFNISPEEANQQYEHWKEAQMMEAVSIGNKWFFRPVTSNNINLKIEVDSLQIKVKVDGINNIKYLHRIIGLLKFLVTNCAESERNKLTFFKIKNDISVETIEESINKHETTSDHEVTDDTYNDPDIKFIPQNQDEEDDQPVFVPPNYDDDEDVAPTFVPPNYNNNDDIVPQFVPPTYNDDDDNKEISNKSKNDTVQDLKKTKLKKKPKDDSSDPSQYVLNKLKEADPKIFKDNKDYPYSKACQMSDKRQPIVITPEEKDAIDNNPAFGKKSYNNEHENYNNFIAYGSDPVKMKRNIFICPEIWCPISKVSMTMEQYIDFGRKCPIEGEKVIDLSNSYWNKIKKKKLKKGNKEDEEDDEGEEGEEGDGTTIIRKKRWIGFSTKGEGCAPCCLSLKPAFVKNMEPNNNMKKIQSCIGNPDTSVKKTVKNSVVGIDASKYIVSAKLIPLEDNRYGLLPQELSELFKNTRCGEGQPGTGNIVPSTKCFVRRGIYHAKPQTSFLDCVNFLLDLGKNNIGEHVIKNLSLESFVIINNGDLCSMFIDSTRSIFDSVEYNNFLKWFDSGDENVNNYIHSFKLQNLKKDILDHSANGFTPNTMKKFKNFKHIMREYLIYNAYKNFERYINDVQVDKSYEILLDLFNTESKMFNPSGLNILLFDVTSSGIYVPCPYDSKHTLNLSEPFVFIIKQGSYYEPICRVTSNETKIVFTDFKFRYGQDPIITKIIDIYKRQCKNKNYKRSVSTGYSVFTYLQSNGFPVRYQVLDYSYKLVGFIIVADKVKLFIPCKAQAPILSRNNALFVYVDSIMDNLSGTTKYNEQIKQLTIIMDQLFKITNDDMYKVKKFYTHGDVGAPVVIAKMKDDTIVPISFQKKEIQDRYLDNLNIFIEWEEEDDRVIYINNEIYKDMLYKLIKNELVRIINKNGKDNYYKDVEFLTSSQNPFSPEFNKKKMVSIIENLMNKLTIPSKEDYIVVDKHTCSGLKRTNCNGICKWTEHINRKSGESQRCKIQCPTNVFNLYRDKLADAFLKQKQRTERLELSTDQRHEIKFDQKDVLSGKVKQIQAAVANPYIFVDQMVDNYVNNIVDTNVKVRNKLQLNDLLTDKWIQLGIDFREKFNGSRKTEACKEGDFCINEIGTENNHPDFLYQLFYIVGKLTNNRAKVTKDIFQRMIENRMITDSNNKEHRVFLTELRMKNACLQTFDKKKDKTVNEVIGFMKTDDYRMSEYELELISEILHVTIYVLGRKTMRNPTEVKCIKVDGEINKRFMFLWQQPPTTGNKTQIGDTYQIIARSQETPQIVFNEEEFMKDESTKNLMQYLKSKCVKHTIKIAS